jgi:hypothetical protein
VVRLAGLRIVRLRGIQAVIFLNNAQLSIRDVSASCVLPWRRREQAFFRELATVNTFIAFRCQDGSYVLVSHADSLPWFKNESVDFLGDVKVDSFDKAAALSIERQLADRNFAWISKDLFHFAWSQMQHRPNHRGEHIHLFPIPHSRFSTAA